VRKELEYRPALLALLGLLCGLATASSPFRIVYLLLLVACLKSRIGQGVVLVAAVLGFCMAPNITTLTSNEQGVSGVGEIVSMPKILEAGTRFTWRKEDRLYDVVLLSRNRELGLGDKLRLAGELRQPSADYQTYYDLNRLSGRVTTDQYALTEPSRIVGMKPALNLRTGFLEWSSSRFSDGNAQLLQAMCLGTDTLLTPTQWKQLRDSGTIHIVSASGFQVSIVAAALTVLLSLLPVARPFMIFVLAGALGIYSLAAGFNAPIIRASAMAIVPLFAYLLRRESDFLSTVACTAFGLLLWRPLWAYDPGFQLSFITVSALGLYGNAASEAEAYLGNVPSQVRTGIIASIASLPLLALHFGTSPVLSLIPNLLIALPSSACVVLALAQFGLSQIGFGFLEPLTGWLIEGLLSYCQVVIQTAAGWSWTMLRFPNVPPDVAACFLIALFGTWRFSRAPAA
jgi:competence protein ComEC